MIRTEELLQTSNVFHAFLLLEICRQKDKDGERSMSVTGTQELDLKRS